ncbi:hypothetical protein PcP3B5_42890 [Pseudomonas citronellolis]|nr:hypothetical protein PcP3B5_42890 [Pseudomonas citronellolis]
MKSERKRVTCRVGCLPSSIDPYRTKQNTPSPYA